MTFTMAPLGTGHRPSCAATATDSVVKWKHFFITEGTTRLHRQDQASQCSLPHHRIPLRCRTVSSSWLGNITPAPCREAKQRWRHVRAPLGVTGELHKQLLQLIVDRRGKEKRQTKNTTRLLQPTMPIPHTPSGWYSQSVIDQADTARPRRLIQQSLIHKADKARPRCSPL